MERDHEIELVEKAGKGGENQGTNKKVYSNRKIKCERN